MSGACRGGPRGDTVVPPPLAAAAGSGADILALMASNWERSGSAGSTGYVGMPLAQKPPSLAAGSRLQWFQFQPLAASSSQQQLEQTLSSSQQTLAGQVSWQVSSKLSSNGSSSNGRLPPTGADAVRNGKRIHKRERESKRSNPTTHTSTVSIHR